jgi:uncharacterized protein (DUF427 family)
MTNVQHGREEERVRDYPRPPRLEPAGRRVRIVLGGETIADTSEALRVLETFHPPTYYLPVAVFRPGVLMPGSARGSWCEWKGRARYWTVAAGSRSVPDAAWGYPDPAPAYADLRGHVAVYADPMDACYVGEERVRPQPGSFYGGWITRELVGPFKGEPGTEGW